MTPTARPRRATPKTPPDPFALLREVAIFADLAPPLLARLAAQGELIEAAADTVLLEQGSVAAFFNILLAGQVGLTSTAADGSTAVVEILRPVDQFQLAAAI